MIGPRLARVPTWLAKFQGRGVVRRFRAARVGMTPRELVAAGVTETDLMNQMRADRLTWEPQSDWPAIRDALDLAAKQRLAIPGGRPCMCCERPFASEGPHNRLCGPCKATYA